MDELDSRRLEPSGKMIRINGANAVSHAVEWTRVYPFTFSLFSDVVAFADEKFMRNYHRGEPSTTLYVKNLAKDVSEKDLLAVFGAVVPGDVDLRFVITNHECSCCQ